MQTTDLQCYCFFKQVREKLLQRSVKLAIQINCVSEKVLFLQLFFRRCLNWTVDMDFILGTNVQYNWLFSPFILYFFFWDLKIYLYTISKIIYYDNSLQLSNTMRKEFVITKQRCQNPPLIISLLLQNIINFKNLCYVNS